jgi:hypothetical protein
MAPEAPREAVHRRKDVGGVGGRFPVARHDPPRIRGNRAEGEVVPAPGSRDVALGHHGHPHADRHHPGQVAVRANLPQFPPCRQRAHGPDPGAMHEHEARHEQAEPQEGGAPGDPGSLPGEDRPWRGGGGRAPFRRRRRFPFPFPSPSGGPSPGASPPELEGGGRSCTKAVARTTGSPMRRRMRAPGGTQSGSPNPCTRLSTTWYATHDPPR